MKSLLKLTTVVVLFFFGSLSVIQAQINSDSQMNATEKVEIPKLFKTYDWLNEVVDYKECKEGKIVVYRFGETRFVYIDKDDKKVLYSDDGSVYCSNSTDINCVDFYKLTDEIDTWNCE